MATATWELVFLLQDRTLRRFYQAHMREKLTRMKQRFTEMRIDWMEEGDQFSVMVGDVVVLKNVMIGLMDWGPQRVQVSITDEPMVHEHRVEAKAALTEGEDEAAISLDLPVPTSSTV